MRANMPSRFQISRGGSPGAPAGTLASWKKLPLAPSPPLAATPNRRPSAVCVIPLGAEPSIDLANPAVAEAAFALIAPPEAGRAT